MTQKDFEKILQQPESTILDFKRNQYSFFNDIELKKTAEFVKDIISFCNTIRNETAYIIIGVGVNADGTKELLGLNEDVDDSVFQEKVKDKATPVPKFSYFTFEFNNSIFGIIEIPVVKYEIPVAATVKLKGLEPGKFYFRRGSSNSEATGYESISIAKWLQSLPDFKGNDSIFSYASEVISMITLGDTSLSACISKALLMANNYKIEGLKSFCHNELSGFGKTPSQEEIHEELSYRTNKVLFTPLKIEISPYSAWDAHRVLRELKKMDDVYESQMFFPQSIIEIEEIAGKLSLSKSMLCTTELPALHFIGDDKLKDLTVTIYTSKDNYDNLLKNIRQKLIDMLLAIQ